MVSFISQNKTYFNVASGMFWQSYGKYYKSRTSFNDLIPTSAVCIIFLLHIFFNTARVKSIPPSSQYIDPSLMHVLYVFSSQEEKIVSRTCAPKNRDASFDIMQSKKQE